MENILDDLDPKTGLRVFHFRGQLRYRCPLKWESGDDCVYDTHDLEALKEHMSAPHNRTGKVERQTRQYQSALVTSEGKPIVYSVPDDLKKVEFKKD
jgi:hypothetical protein